MIANVLAVAQDVKVFLYVEDSFKFRRSMGTTVSSTTTTITTTDTPIRNAGGANPANVHKFLSDTDVSVTIGTSALTAGKFKVFIPYIFI